MQVMSLTQANAEQIVQWHYPAEYAFYNTDADPDDCAELLSPSRRGDRFYQVIEDERLLGYFCTEETSQAGVVEIGLGLAPDWTGKGYGVSFVQLLVAHVIEVEHPRKLLMNVAQFNQRAQKVYQRAGFEIVKTYDQVDDMGKRYPFVWMAKTIG